MRCHALLVALTPIPACLCLSGCTPAPTPTRPIDQDMNQELSALDRVGVVRFPMVRTGSVLPGELERPFDWHWTGRVDDGVKAIADRVGYHFIDAPPPRLPLIRIDRDQASAAELLDALASASAGYAAIDIDIPAHIIRVSWHA